MVSVWWVLLFVLVVLICYLVVREVLSFTRLSRYTKQGFGREYHPLLGEFKPILDGQNHKNEFKVFDDLANKHQGKPGLVFNCSNGYSSWVQILDNDLAREFLSKENDVVVRVPTVDIKTSIGFLMIGGEQAVKQRAAFSDIFRRENLERIAPQILSTVENHLEKTFGEPSMDTALNVGLYENSNKFLEGLMQLFSNNLVYHDPLQVPLSDQGLGPAEEFISISDLALSPSAGTHPLNFLLGGLPHNKCWLSASREVRRRASKLEKSIKDYISQRETVLSKATGRHEESQFNIIDAMVLHNLDCEKSGRHSDKISLEDMAGNCNMFTFASFDTTLTSSNSLLFHLGQSPELQERLLQEIKNAGLINGIRSIEDIDNCNLLNDVILEALRVFPPGPITFDRMVLQDFKIGKYKFYKGDIINVSFAPNMWDSNNFSTGKQFGLNNRNSKNKKYFLPFSTGKRACVGQLLAELELKQILICLLPKYKILPVSKPEDVRYYLSFAMKLDNCFVKLVPRN